MTQLNFDDRLILLQYAIEKFDSETTLKEKLSSVLTTKDIERAVDTLIVTQKVRRIGQDVLQNNTSHTGGLPEMPDHLKEIISRLEF